MGKEDVKNLCEELKNSRLTLDTQNKEHLKVKEKLGRLERDNGKLKGDRLAMIDKLAQTREECYLAAISEKDSSLALMEQQNAPISQIRDLKRERENLVSQLKIHTENRMKYDSSSNVVTNNSTVSQSGAKSKTDGIWA